jgi:hypothetical protein
MLSFVRVGGWTRKAYDLAVLVAVAGEKLVRIEGEEVIVLWKTESSLKDIGAFEIA